MGPAEVMAVVALAGGAALVQSTTGFGFGLLIVPPLVLLLGPTDAVVLSNVLATGLAGMMLYWLHGAVEWRTVLLLVGASVVGMPGGLLVLTQFPASVLQIIIAGAVIVFTLLLIRGATVGSETTKFKTLVVGLVAGILRMATSMSGPPVVLYLQGTGMRPGPFRSTLTAFFFIAGVMAVVAYAIEGSLDADLGLTGLIAVPAVLLGLTAGGRIYPYIREAQFRGFVFAVLLTSATLAIATAIWP